MAKSKRQRRDYNRTTLGQSVHNIKLPSHIKCVRCKTMKGQACYSTVRLLDLKVASHKDRRHGLLGVMVIPCTMCTGHQATEMECTTCDTYYPKDTGFSKAQRKDPDNATCWRCMQDRLNDEPYYGSSDEDFEPEDRDYDSDDSEGGTNVGGGTTMGSSNFGSSSGGVPLSATLALNRLNLNSVPSSVPSRRGPASIASTSVASTTATGNNRNFAKPHTVLRKHEFVGAKSVVAHNEKKQKAIERDDLNEICTKSDDSDSN